MSTPETALFKDLNFNFTKHPVTGALGTLTNEDAVKQALRNLILTNFYERPYNPDFGADVRNMLFENFTPFTSLQLKKNIQTAIGNFEPRVQLLDINVKAVEDRHELTVDIVFRVVNQLEPTTLSVILERIK